MATYHDLKALTTEAIEDMLMEHKFRKRRLSAKDLATLSAALDAERPSAYNIMITLANALAFLTQHYEGDQANIPVISDFLASFQAHVAQEMLTKEPTVKQGLTLLPESSSA